MAKLEHAVQELKQALDELNVRVESQHMESADKIELIQLYKSQANTARGETENLAKDLALIIKDLRSLIDQD